MSPVQRGGPAFYACLPCGVRIAKEDGTHDEGARLSLVSILWKHSLTTNSPRRQCHLSSSRATTPSMQVVHDPLGKPQLLLGGYRGPAISFSEAGGTVWAALGADESEIGIDVAAADEFQGDYPLRRVFSAAELEHAVGPAGGDVGQAAALLWSIKEAAVKAMGCGFHLVEPRDLEVQPALARDGGHAFPVCLSRKALARLPRHAQRSIWVRSLPQGRMWLSIAFLN